MNPGYQIDPDYVDVAERIRLFYEQYPEGRLTTAKVWVETAGGTMFACCVAQAWRTPDDPHPCDGVAWEPIPGPTPFTRDSELMNAQTSAWGRAIVAAGIPAKKIATTEDVQARTQQDAQARQQETGGEPVGVTPKQHSMIGALIKELHEMDMASSSPDEVRTDWVETSRAWVNAQFGKHSRADLTNQEASSLINWLLAAKEAEKKKLADRMAETEALVEAEDIPFG